MRTIPKMDKEEKNTIVCNSNKNRCTPANTVLSEFWVFQEKVDMKVSAFSFTTSLLVFGYL